MRHKQQETYYISFCKDQPERVRVEFVIVARGKHEARLIAEREAASLKGYRLQDVN